MSRATRSELSERLRALPSVDELASSLSGVAHQLAVAAARAEIADARTRVKAGGQVPSHEELIAQTSKRATESAQPSLLRVINATGVVLHTNLGRAPLAERAIESSAAVATGYSNLEYDLASGERGSRHAHVAGLLRDLTDAEEVLAVNNNAAAVMLAIAATSAGREVIVGRGQLVEIGDSFRIPDILAATGARLVEVGATNRTRAEDYIAAVGPHTATILRVHQSNFRTVGFVEDAPLAELAELASERELTLIDDLGSGATDPIGDEPLVRDSVATGADIVCFSADKLLGGPQAGILAGRSGAVELCRRHPFGRAVRLDKLQLAALEGTLRGLRDDGPEALPARAMLAASTSELRVRAEKLASFVGEPANVAEATSRPGGGTLPTLELSGSVCIVDPGEVGCDELARRLRVADPPVVVRIHEHRVVLDPRTIRDDEVRTVGVAVRAALDG